MSEPRDPTFSGEWMPRSLSGRQTRQQAANLVCIMLAVATAVMALPLVAAIRFL